MKAIRNRAQLERMMIRAMLAHFDGDMKNAVRFARNGKVYSPAVAELERLLLPYLVQGAMLGAVEGLGPLISLGMGFDVALVNEAAVAFAKQYAYTAHGKGLAEAIVAHSRQVIQRETAAWLTSGDKIDELIQALSPTFGKARAETIAVTEITNAIAGGNTAAWREVNKQLGSEIITGRVWNTANDERVCFPAWTLIKTEDGEKPIQWVRPGDMVWTRYGLRKVKAISKRSYVGGMVSVKAGRYSVVSTADHPYWTLEKGWLQGRYLNSRHSLQTFGDEIVRVNSVSEFSLGNSYNVPSSPFQKFVFSSVPVGVMPVVPVNFESDPIVMQQKVNAVSPHSGLLHKTYPHCLKCDPDISFEQVFAAKSTIARERAELPGFRFFGLNSEFFPAVFARFKNRRSSAFFGAIMAVKVFLHSESDTASQAVAISSVCGSTLPATNGKPISFASVDSEGFSANGADFCHLIGPGRFITLPATKSPFLNVLGALKRLPALFARNFCRFCKNSIALARTERVLAFSLIRSRERLFAIMTGVFKKHVSLLLTRLIISYRRLLCKDFEVYNLEIDEHPEYFANGVLVHNCPICAPLGGLAFGEAAVPASIEQQERRAMTAALDKPFTHPGGKGAAGAFGGQTYERPPAHPRCRCTLAPVVAS